MSQRPGVAASPGSSYKLEVEIVEDHPSCPSVRSLSVRSTACWIYGHPLVAGNDLAPTSEDVIRSQTDALPWTRLDKV
jgi:hypothetical protein